MLAYIKGEVLAKSDNYLIVLNNNIGYKVFLPSLAWAKYQPGEEAEFFLYHQVREDHLALYGLSSFEEKKLFELLVSVSGIGPRSALAFFDTYTNEDIVAAIASSNIAAITKVSGVGKKTAEKVILELKDKIKKVFTVNIEHGNKTEFVAGFSKLEERFRSELVMALSSLGYNSREIEKTIKDNEELLTETTSVEDGIRLLLRNLR